MQFLNFKSTPSWEMLKKYKKIFEDMNLSCDIVYARDICLKMPLNQLIEKLDNLIEPKKPVEMIGFGAKLSSGSVPMWSCVNPESKLDEQTVVCISQPVKSL